jgi:lysophospholipase L1-like esterase
MPIRSNMKRFLRFALSALIGFLVLEICARVDDLVSFGAPVLQAYSRDNLFQYDSLGLRGKPYSSYKKWRLNSLGFRSAEVQMKRFRIVCLGQSETFGMYEQPGNEYPAQLERDLNRGFAREVFQVINAAIPKQTLASTAKRVPTMVAETQPQIAIVYAAPSYYIWLPGLGARELDDSSTTQMSHLRIWGNFQNLLKGMLPELVQMELNQLQIKRRVETQRYPIMDQVPEENVKRFSSDLLAVVDALRANGVQPVLVTHATYFGNTIITSNDKMLIEWRKFYPMLKERGFLDMEKRMNATIRDLAAAQHIPLIDIAKEMPAGPEYFADMVHFTDEGASIMAAKLVQGLEPVIETRGFPGVVEHASTTRYSTVEETSDGVNR